MLTLRYNVPSSINTNTSRSDDLQDAKFKNLQWLKKINVSGSMTGNDVKRQADDFINLNKVSQTAEYMTCYIILDDN